MRISREEFEAIVAQAVVRIPASVRESLGNVAFLVEDDVAPELRNELELGDDDLLGLFQGRTRGEEVLSGSYLPPTITLYRLPHAAGARTRAELEQEVADTVWHEVAHYLGLDEDDVHREERRIDEMRKGEP